MSCMTVRPSHSVRNRASQPHSPVASFKPFAPFAPVPIHRYWVRPDKTRLASSRSIWGVPPPSATPQPPYYAPTYYVVHGSKLSSPIPLFKEDGTPYTTPAWSLHPPQDLPGQMHYFLRIRRRAGPSQRGDKEASVVLKVPNAREAKNIRRKGKMEQSCLYAKEKWRQASNKLGIDWSCGWYG